jgi:hypothetical protein
VTVRETPIHLSGIGTGLLVGREIGLDSETSVLVSAVYHLVSGETKALYLFMAESAY